MAYTSYYEDYNTNVILAANEPLHTIRLQEYAVQKQGGSKANPWSDAYCSSEPILQPTIPKLRMSSFNAVKNCVHFIFADTKSIFIDKTSTCPGESKEQEEAFETEHGH